LIFVFDLLRCSFYVHDLISNGNIGVSARFSNSP
jgi:hypothetical protein